jgi:hypothetical protein
MTAFENSITPRVKGVKVEFFYGSKANTQVTTTGWRVWTKPKGCSMVHFMCIGGGGGGAGGFVSTLLAAGGGGGGGSGSVTVQVVPAFFLPRQLYVFAGNAGTGGVSGASGTAATDSRVCSIPNPTINAQAVCVSGTAGATGGVVGTVGAGGAAGSRETAATTLTGGPWAGHGLQTLTVGLTGGAGTSIVGVPAGLTWGAASIPIGSGLGGGSIDVAGVAYAGGSYNSAQGGWEIIPGGAAGGFPGADGTFTLPTLNQTWTAHGGTGGGANASGNGGRGGHAGGYGSGGGGGGAAPVGFLGGVGGDGSPGFIMIASW